MPLSTRPFSVSPALAEDAPLSVFASKITISEVMTDPDKRDFGPIACAGVAWFDSTNYREGRAAFVEKRQPNFQGR